MADGSKIEWTDDTWNPIVGCSLVSPGCTNCYAMGQAPRTDALSIGAPYAGVFGKLTQPSKNGPVWTGALRFVEHRLGEPLRKKQGRRIFVNSMSDLFHEDVPDEWIDKIFAVMAMCPQHTFQILTKRPERMRAYIRARKERQPFVCPGEGIIKLQWEAKGKQHWRSFSGVPPWPLPNVWLGVSVEDQERAEERIPILLETPAAIRWISAEPLLGPLDLKGWCHPGWDGDIRHARPAPRLRWVVIGGESGRNARPMHPDWARSLRDQCAAACVPFFFKQWGEWGPGAAFACDLSARKAYRGEIQTLEIKGSRAIKICIPTRDDDAWGSPLTLERFSKKAAGNLLDGRNHLELPEIRA